ncbi:MAG: hypothetical protein WCA19_22865 [Candidatus Acidiferrales bacterium]
MFGAISLGSPVTRLITVGTINVINTQNSEPVVLDRIDALGGPFYWSLPPGQYAILDLLETTQLGFTTESTDRLIRAKFAIDSEQTVIYVGTLNLATPVPFVTDDFSTAVRALHSHFPALDTTPIKQLLQIDKPR